jgi:tRNA 5-methylaminomethyl-2-thiouridine biosynthesis bifunctional protein
MQLEQPIKPVRLALDANGTPVSEAYGDVYHSAAGGHEQALHVFLAGNGLPGAWQGKERFVILETGFGLGLNFLATWLAWRNDPQRCAELQFISLEKHPFSADDLAQAQGVWPEFAALSEELHRHWPALIPGEHRLELDGGRVVLRLVFGEASETLGRLNAAVDAFYLDGFSPAKNPAMWSPALCLSLARLANPGATLATWSVAGSVRRALTAAQFAVQKSLGFAGKRQMLVGQYMGVNK